MKALLLCDFFSPLKDVIEEAQKGKLPRGLKGIRVRGMQMSAEGLVHVVTFEVRLPSLQAPIHRLL